LEVWIDSLLAKKTRSYGCRGQAETEIPVIAARDWALQSKYHGTKILNSLMRQWKTSNQRAQYGKKNNTQRDMTVFAQLQFNT
jgi:hypothetical protein